MSQQVGGGQAWKGWKRRKLGRARGGRPSTSGDGGCVCRGVVSGGSLELDVAAGARLVGGKEKGRE